MPLVASRQLLDQPHAIVVPRSHLLLERDGVIHLGPFGLVFGEGKFQCIGRRMKNLQLLDARLRGQARIGTGNVWRSLFGSKVPALVVEADPSEVLGIYPHRKANHEVSIREVLIQS